MQREVVVVTVNHGNRKKIQRSMLATFKPDPVEHAEYAIPFLMVDVSSHCVLCLHILSLRPSLSEANDVLG